MPVGIVDVGSSSGSSYKDVKITFKNPFPKDIPGHPSDPVVVVATVVYPLDKDKYTDRYTVNVANITTKGFTAIVAGSKKWDVNLKLNYYAEQMPV